MSLSLPVTRSLFIERRFFRDLLTWGRQCQRSAFYGSIANVESKWKGRRRNRESSGTEVIQTVNPVAVRYTGNKKYNNNRKNRGPSARDWDAGDVDPKGTEMAFRRDLLSQFEESGDLDVGEMETDALEPDKRFEDYAREEEWKSDKGKRYKLYRKHFRGVIDEPELNVLTYGEKEKIRFLYQSDPERWTPDMISASFPISTQGAIKLLKSKFKLKTYERIMQHDREVAEKIEKIKNGDIEMTPELAKKMEMREKVPFTVGAVDPTNKELLLRLQPAQKEIGEFQRLVAPPNKPKEMASASSTKEGLPAVVPAGNDSSHPSGYGIGVENPDLGDSYLLPRTGDIEQTKRKLRFSMNRLMTFDQFKEKMEQADNIVDNPEVKYIKELDKESRVNKTDSSRAISMEQFEQEERAMMDETTVRKFKDLSVQKNEDEEDVGEERIRPGLRHNSHESLRPPQPSPPRRLVKEGSVYRDGSSYYDENGEFLYRVF